MMRMMIELCPTIPHIVVSIFSLALEALVSKMNILVRQYAQFVLAYR